MKAEFIIVSNLKKLTTFMRACDVFEKGKFIGNTYTFTVTFDDDVEINQELIQKTIQKLASTPMEHGELMFVTLNSHLIKHTPYFNPEGRILSTGSKWTLMADFIKNLGYKVETDENMYLKSVTQ